jgi:hypothetical protein
MDKTKLCVLMHFVEKHIFTFFPKHINTLRPAVQNFLLSTEFVWIIDLRTNTE